LESIYQQKLITLAELKQSLLQKTFSGELPGGKEESTATLKEEEVA
jgi:type I restriction enzyme S subunit